MGRPLFRICNVQGSYITPCLANVSDIYAVVFSFPGRCRDRTSHYAVTASFLILSTSLLTNNRSSRSSGLSRWLRQWTMCEHTCEHTCTVMSRRASVFTALSVAQTVQCVQGCTSVLEGGQKVTTVIAGCFAGRTCKNRCKGCTWPPKLLCNFYSLYIIYKCGRGPRVTSWRGEVSTPLLCIVYRVEW